MNAVQFARIALDFFVFRRDRPLILGLALTDVCNLRCRHCRVANVHCRHMTWEEIGTVLSAQYRAGARFLYLEGGEPHLWRDGERGLSNIVGLARDTGYLKIHLYTNGTMPLDDSPDLTWVSVDGLPATHEKLRGGSFARVWQHIQGGPRPLVIIYTVNTVNAGDIPGFLKKVREELPGIRVNFYFHTPYYGIDSLLPSTEVRQRTVRILLDLKKAGLPVFNSAAGLKALASSAFRRPLAFTRVVDQTGEYNCCRAIGTPEVCRSCGYSTCAELSLLQNFHPGVIREALRLF